MNKKIITLIIILIIVFGSYKWGKNINNTAIELEANAKTAWSNVESTYQRRNDLYSSLVKSIRASANFERKTLREVIKARSEATSVKIDANNLTEEKLQMFQKAQSHFNSSFDKLLLTFERYPELQTTQQFREFNSQKEGTENRIEVARKRYNEAVNKYDIYTTKFPNKIFASLFGFKEMFRFKAEEGTDKIPEEDYGDLN